MSTRNSRADGDTPNTAAALAPLNFMADLPRRQLALMNRSFSVLYRSSEALRKVQQQAAHRATARHEQAAERLRGQCDFAELMSIQTELLRSGLEEAAQYWQQLASAVLKVQVEMAGTTSEVLDSGSEPTLEALQQAFEASLNGAGNAAPTAH